MKNRSPSAVLAQFVANTGFDDLPPATVVATKRCLLDAIGVSMAATTLGEGVTAFADLADAQQAIATSTILGRTQKSSALLAAMVNGALAHALDFEDAHDGALVHPNAATVPAALAVAQAIGMNDGKRLITALAIGCEIVCRMGLSLRAALDDFGWYPPPILSAFGATATAAHLYGLNERQIVDAFSLTLCQTSCSAEIKYSPNSLIRAVRDSFAAKTGVLSAELAQRGVSGFDQPFEGKAGFFAMFARGNYEPDDLTRELGIRFAIDDISFKPWPTCRGTHVYIEAAIDLMREHKLLATDVANVSTLGSRINRMLAEPIERKRAPATAIDAKFSIPFAVATALIQGDVRLEDFRAEALASPGTLELARRVEYAVDPTSTESPSEMTRGALTLTTHAGQQFTRRADKPLGHPERPLSDAALVAKFLGCAKHYARPLTADDTQRLADTILRIDTIENSVPQMLSHL